MALFDPVEAFERQFTPTDGGYLYYPSRRSGGKLVTTEEYQSLFQNWEKIAGRSGIWKCVAVLMLPIVILLVVEVTFELPVWADSAVILVNAGALLAWLSWHAYAPRRLVRGRPDVTPPRTLSESRKIARSIIPWSQISAVMFITAVFFIIGLDTSERTWGWWVIKIVSGLLFAAFAWIGFKKWQDSRD
jgi:hypothetical protein